MRLESRKRILLSGRRVRGGLRSASNGALYMRLLRPVYSRGHRKAKPRIFLGGYSPVPPEIVWGRIHVRKQDMPDLPNGRGCRSPWTDLDRRKILSNPRRLHSRVSQEE